MRNIIAIEEKGSVREFILHDLSHIGLRIDTNKHRNFTFSQGSPYLTHQSKQSHGSRVFNVPLHQMDTISVHIDELDLTVPVFLQWCFDQIRRSIKQEGLFRKSGGSQRIKELLARIDDGCLTPNLSSSNTVFDVCSLFKEFLRRLTSPLITYPIQDLLLDCSSMRSIPNEKKLDIYCNIVLLLPDEHLHALIYILRFLHEITLHERDNKMNAKNLAICVGPGIMRTNIDGKSSIMTEQCATSVSDIVETLIIHAMKLGYIAESIYDRSQMLLEMRQKETVQGTDDSFAIENSGKPGSNNGKNVDPSSARKRRSGSVKEFLVHMTNRFRRRSGSNNESRDHTTGFLDQSGKFSSSQCRDHRYYYPFHQQNSMNEPSTSPTSNSANLTTKRKSTDDPNSSNSKRGKTKTGSQEKVSMNNANRFTSPLSAFRRKKKTSCHSNDPGFPFKIEHSHLPQLLHFTDEVPIRFTNTLVNPVSSVSSSSSSLASKAAAGALGTSILGNESIANGETLHTSMTMNNDTPMLVLSNPAITSCNNKSFDTKKLNLLDSWKWPKATRKAERKPLIAIHAPMLVPPSADSCSIGELCPSPIKANDDSVQTLTQQIGSSSLLMHTSFGFHRHHSDDISGTSFTTTTTFRPRRSISSNSGQQQTRHIVCPSGNHSHLIPSRSETDDADPVHENATDPDNNLNATQEKDSFQDEDDEDNTNELNLAVMVVHEDAQSLRGFVNEPTAPENTSLDEAFIDETDIERVIAQATSESEASIRRLVPSNSEHPVPNDIVPSNNDHEQQTNQAVLVIPVLMEKNLNTEENLDDILRRNEKRPIQLTDSDDEDEIVTFNENTRTTPRDCQVDQKTQSASATPKAPVRLSSSISSLISSNSLMDLPLPRCAGKDYFLSTSFSTMKSASIHLSENEENISLLHGGRESLLVLKDKLAGRVSQQVRVIEQRSNEQEQNRSVISTTVNDPLVSHAPVKTNNMQKNPFINPVRQTSEQVHIESALTRGKKLVRSSIDPAEMTRSVKRLQNMAGRRSKKQPRSTEWEKHRRVL